MCRLLPTLPLCPLLPLRAEFAGMEIAVKAVPRAVTILSRNAAFYSHSNAGLEHEDFIFCVGFDFGTGPGQFRRLRRRDGQSAGQGLPLRAAVQRAMLLRAVLPQAHALRLPDNLHALRRLLPEAHALHLLHNPLHPLRRLLPEAAAELVPADFVPDKMIVLVWIVVVCHVSGAT
jgi:hypothetical protein